MRKLFFIVPALLVACGSDSKDRGGLSGTVGGRNFSPVEVRAIPAGTGATPCSVDLGGTSASVGVKAIALEITSYAGACEDFASSQCRVHGNAQNVTLLVARLNAIPPGTEPTLAPGTYTVYEDATIPVPDASNPGLLTVAFAQALATDATCVGTPSPVVRGGTVRLDQVTGPVTGRLSLTFQDGSTLEGDFSAPLCPGVNPEICDLVEAHAICTLPPACLP